MSGDERDREGSRGGYVHRPGDLPDAEERSKPAASSRGAGDADVPADANHRGLNANSPGADAGRADADEGLGARGWVLVGVVILATLVIPGIIYLFPASPDRAGLPFLVAMLALPLVPAVLLGAVAVWSAVADRRVDGKPDEPY